MATISEEQLALEGLTIQDRETAMLECLQVFTQLWNDRRGQKKDTLDFVSALANADATSDIDPAVDPVTYLGTLMLLIVGGNDTTRNTISGGVVALNEFPEQYDKLRNDPSLIPTFVDEVIRWQTPLAHMRRTATRDTELGGQKIKKGDAVAMWYVSANRDETAIERAQRVLDRPRGLEEAPLVRLGRSTSAWAAASPRCRSACSGKRSSSASAWSRWSASPSACAPASSRATRRSRCGCILVGGRAGVFRSQV